MAYQPIADKSIGDVLPADDWNQLIENNASNPAGLAQARGDLFEGSAATTLRRIAIGASGRLLRARSTGNVYEAPMVTAPNNLNNSSRDDEVVTWGAARQRFLPLTALFTEISDGFDITVGTSLELNLPSGHELDDFRWLDATVGAVEGVVSPAYRFRREDIPSPPSGGTLYAVNFNQVYTVNISTGIVTALPNTLSESATGIFAFGSNFYTIDSRSNIRRLNLTTGQNIGNEYTPTQTINSGDAVLHNGQVYVIGGTRLTRISIDDASETIIVTVLFTDSSPPAEAVLFTHQGVLYADWTRQLYRVDLVNNAYVAVGSQRVSGDVIRAAYSFNGTVYAFRFDDDTLYEFDVDDNTLGTALPNATGLADMDGMVDSNAGGDFLDVGGWFNVQRNSDTRVTLYPTQTGYVAEVLGIL